MHEQIHPWQEPLDVLTRLESEETLLCFYSAFKEAHTGQHSFICWGEHKSITGKTWDTLASALSNNKAWHENAWFGWLGYSLRNNIESLSHGSKSPLEHAPLHMMQFSHLLRFDHDERTVTYHFINAPSEKWITNQSRTAPEPCHVTTLASNMDKASYLKIVNNTIKRIQAGDFYQANITRKFFGTCSASPTSAYMFVRLCELSPAPYSAFIKQGKDSILSSSPECFLSIDAKGRITTRPIKGSAKRNADALLDKTVQNSLLNSEKDNAENRMIVDLMRNDLSRASVHGSVKASTQPTLHSYTTIHHLIATITAQKRHEITTLDAVKMCFPPGSMTGAPKIAAMEWCTQQEQQERDIYSGAIGWFGGDGSCDLSVVIRTLKLRGSEFEFQVGGGIVADSDPVREWQETLTKARAICTLLGISLQDIEAL